nr:right-handed parallel beta-helix repeat-containing protein [Candidatus Krumholzibacteria bacterium]
MRTLIYLTLMLVLPSLGFGRTWVVEKDGSGDFTVIQDAVDAAESGDVIEIGPGRYEEFQVFHNVYTWDNFVFVYDKSLTFQGAGVDQTIIGPSDPDMTPHYAYGITSDDYSGQGYLIVSDITFDNLNSRGIASGFGYLEVTDCSFSHSNAAINFGIGISSRNTNESIIRNCHFENLPDYCIITRSPTAGLLIEDCQFENSQYGMGFWGSGTSDILVRNCHLSAPPAYQGGSGFYVSSGASIEVDNCYAEFFNDAITVSDSHVVVHDSVLRFSDRAEINMAYDSSLHAYNNIIETEIVGLFAGYPTPYPVVLNNNHFLRHGDGIYV